MCREKLGCVRVVAQVRCCTLSPSSVWVSVRQKINEGEDKRVPIFRKSWNDLVFALIEWSNNWMFVWLLYCAHKKGLSESSAPLYSTSAVAFEVSSRQHGGETRRIASDGEVCYWQIKTKTKQKRSLGLLYFSIEMVIRKAPGQKRDAFCLKSILTWYRPTCLAAFVCPLFWTWLQSASTESSIKNIEQLSTKKCNTSRCN